MIKNELEKIIKKALADLGIEAESVCLDHPVDLAMGDYSTNVAMVYAKKIGQNPCELAEKIAEKINLETGFPSEMLEKVEVAGAGFINFYLSKDFFENNIAEILKAGEKYGSNESLKGKKVMVEYTDPNPFKEIHIGHLMSNAIGESISRIIEKNGAKVIRANFQGDVGMHVAKAVWARMKNIKKTSPDTYEGIFPITEYGKAYAVGDEAYRNDEFAKEEIIAINKQIYNIDLNKTYSGSTVEGQYQEGRKKSLEYFETIYKKLGTKFDEYFFESETGKIGKEIVEENIGKIFEKSDNAVVFKAENFDKSLHTRVFLNSEGLPTYEAKDLGLIKIKFEKHPDLDLSISVTGNEVAEYFKVMLKAVELINPNWSQKTKHISHGMLRLPEGKMSSRTGDVITAESLIDKVEKIISEKTDDKKTAEQVAIGAIKYSVLKSTSGKDIIFDFDKSLAVEGNSGPYLQYTYARAKSVIEKAKKENIATWKPGFQVELRLLNSLSEVEKLLYRFPEVVERAGEEYEPHYIATYLFELAQAFNSYYGNNKIADKEDENAPYKVALTEAVAQTIKNGLWLLGIEAPEKL